MFIFLIIGILVGAIIIIFAIQNIAVVSVTFLVWQFEGSLALILVLAVAAGMVLSSLLSIPLRMKRRAELVDLKKREEVLSEAVVVKNSEVEMEKSKVEAEKSKLAANNAYIDDLEKTPRV